MFLKKKEKGCISRSHELMTFEVLKKKICLGKLDLNRMSEQSTSAETLG